MRISDWSSDVCSSDLDASTKRKRLLEGQPMQRGIALGHGGNPKGQDVDAPLGNAGRAERDIRCGAAIPRFRRRPGADRTSVESGKSVSARSDSGGRRRNKKKKRKGV